MFISLLKAELLIRKHLQSASTLLSSHSLWRLGTPAHSLSFQNPSFGSGQIIVRVNMANNNNWFVAEGTDDPWAFPSQACAPCPACRPHLGFPHASYVYIFPLSFSSDVNTHLIFTGIIFGLVPWFSVEPLLKLIGPLGLTFATITNNLLYSEADSAHPGE